MPRNILYPHLLPPDVPVWEWFLHNHGDQYLRFDYDVRVGPGVHATGVAEKRVRQSAFDLSRRRVDAVGYRSNGIDIIEITQRADLKAIGQLVSYPILYIHTFGSHPGIQSLLVCEELLVGIDIVLAELPVKRFISGVLSKPTDGV